MIIDDLSGTKDVEGSGFTPPPPGDYTLRATKADDAPSKSGKPMLTINFRVVGGEFTGAFVSDRFTFVKDDGTPNEFSKGLLKNMLKCMGLPPGGIDSERIVGRMVDATVTVEPQHNDPTKFSARPTSYRKCDGAQAEAAGSAVSAAAPPPVPEGEVPF